MQRRVRTADRTPTGPLARLLSGHPGLARRCDEVLLQTADSSSGAGDHRPDCGGGDPQEGGQPHRPGVVSVAGSNDRSNRLRRGRRGMRCGRGRAVGQPGQAPGASGAATCRPPAGWRRAARPPRQAGDRPEQDQRSACGRTRSCGIGVGQRDSGGDGDVKRRHFSRRSPL